MAISESIRSRAWHAAKAAADEQWQRHIDFGHEQTLEGRSDMLQCVSKGVDAALEEILGEK
jgi:hypothetical protein